MKRDVSELMPESARREAIKLIPAQFNLTEAGNAKRFCARNRGQVIFCPPRNKWFQYDGRRYALDERGTAVELAKATALLILDEAVACTDDEQRKHIVKHSMRSQAAAQLRSMLFLAQSEPGMAVLPQELDADPWVWNAPNGTVELRTGKLRAHRREDLITKCAGAVYDPGATSDVWDSFLDTFTAGDKELAAYLQRAVGCALPGVVAEKAFWQIKGPPDGAKSTFIHAIGGMFGDYHVAAASSTWLVRQSVGGNRGDLVRLMGARLVTSVEFRKGAKFDEETIKAATGGDEIVAAAKFENELRFKAAFALWLAFNDAPATRDDDEGMWARIRCIPALSPIPKDKQDRGMSDKLATPEARAAILAWAVRGCLDWQKNGLGTCSAVEKATAGYRSDMDRVAGFFTERCSFETDATVATKALREAYTAWCEEMGVRPLSGKELAARLRLKGGDDVKSGSVRGWCGVRLLGQWEAPLGTARTPGTPVSREGDPIPTHESLLGTAVPAVSAVQTDTTPADWTDADEERWSATQYAFRGQRCDFDRGAR